MALALILTVAAGCLACSIIGRLLLNDGVGATPTPLALPPTPAVTPSSSPTLPPTPTATHTFPATHTLTATTTSTPIPISTPTHTSSPTASPTSTPTVTPTSTIAPSPTPVTLIDPSLTESESLTKQLEAMPVGQRIVVVLHDDHFTQELAAYLATNPQAIYRDVNVRFLPGQVEVQGQIRVLGVWIPATVWSDLQVEHCRIKAPITDFSVGGVLTPSFLRDEAGKLVQSELEKALDDLFKSLPVCLERIEVSEGVATAEGTKLN